MPAMTRRTFALGASAAIFAPATTALGQEVLSLSAGLDATAAISSAALASGGRIQLPAGRFSVENLRLPSGTMLVGSGPATILQGSTIFALQGSSNVTIADMTLDGTTGSAGPLISAGGCEFLRLQNLVLSGSVIGVDAWNSGGSITDCRFEDFADAAIHSLDSSGFTITGCTIARCGNGGIRIWRSAPGYDGSIVSGNRISAIDWVDGGNGQNGNGVNVFRADNVIVGDNQFDDCAFTAIRLNATRNTIVRGNMCRTSGEVAIFSEFEFAGSVISDNLVDGAAAGISMTNLDSGGYLASCTGNIVRNISPSSAVNPDTVPYGIAAEADAVISGNVVEDVPGLGIVAGYGPFLRNVVISDNVVRGTRIGIGVSIAEGAGAVHIADNLIAETETPIAGLAWDDIVEPNLADNADRFSNVTVDANRIA